MTRIVPVIVLMLISLCQANAQNIRGGFGHAYFGTAMNVSPDIQHDLRSSALLGSDLQLNRLGVFGGGGGYGVLGRRILLGGSGLGYRVADATLRGQAALSMGGGLINFGYIVTLRDNYMAFPYIGIGGKGLNLRIENDTDESFTIGNTTIAPGDELELNSGGISFEAGYALHFFAFPMSGKGSHHGFMVGVQAGTFLFAGLEDWRIESSEDMVPSFSKAFSFAPYIRLTIGGGGFKVEEEE